MECHQESIEGLINYLYSKGVVLSRGPLLYAGSGYYLVLISEDNKPAEILSGYYLVLISEDNKPAEILKEVVRDSFCYNVGTNLYYTWIHEKDLPFLSDVKRIKDSITNDKERVEKGLIDKEVDTEEDFRAVFQDRTKKAWENLKWEVRSNLIP